MSTASILDRHAAQRPGDLAYVFLPNGESSGPGDSGEERVTYGELRRRARAIGARLQERGAAGQCVLLLFPPGLDYIAGFLGCIYAGAIAVPAYPPDPSRLGRTLPRIEAVVADARARFVLTTSLIMGFKEVVGEHAPGLAASVWLAVEDAPADGGASLRDPTIDGPGHGAGNGVAMLQYTSGSTGTPRGVVLTHENLAHNLEAIHRVFEHGPESRGVIWLPPYHDMGLIGGILQPLYGGFPAILMSPLDFLARPLRWLQAVSRYRGTTSGGPNFAYDLCVRKTTPEDRAALDLSTWTVAFNGAEPIQPETLDRFAEAFAPCGFRREAFFPCYGLAEATLIASGGPKRNPPTVTAFGRAARVGSGAALSDQELAIVDPEHRTRMPAGREGEIWVRGPSVARGYWGRDEETRSTFHATLATESGDGAKSYLRTGDLGFLADGELFVTGRIKDLVIVRGRNHYPQDIERTAVACHGALRPGCSAAFTISPEEDPNGRERLVLVQEVDVRRPYEPQALLDSIRAAVMEAHGVHLHQVLLIAPGTIPKTTSGKIQRRACKAAHLSDQLQVLARARDESSEPASSDEPPSVPAPGESSERARLEEQVLAMVAAALEIPPARIDRRAPLVALGLDSLRTVELKAALESVLGASVQASELLDGMSTEQLMAHGWEAFSRSSCRETSAVASSSLPRAARDQDHPLSYAQEEIWLAARLHRDDARYAIPAALSLRGPLRIDWLERALETVIVRHEALRTRFPEVDGQPRQRVMPASRVALEVEDVRGQAPQARERWARDQALAEARRPFDLARGPLYRARLLRLEDEQYVLLFTVHHIVADGWSMGILIDEWTALYRSYHRAEAPSLPELPYPYIDFSLWQREQLTRERRESLLAHWKNELRGLPEDSLLPTDRPHRGAPDGRGASLRITLPAAIHEALVRACAPAEATPFMWLLAVFDLLLARTTHQEDLAVGVAALGRSLPGTERLIGNFVNMLVFRARLDGDPPFRELVRRTKRTSLAALEHDALPLEILMRDGFPERSARQKPLFRAAFGVQNQPRSDFSLPDLTVAPLSLDPGAARLDLTLWISETPAGLECVWTYATALFEPSTVARLHAQFERLLRASLDSPERRLSALSFDESPPERGPRRRGETSIPSERARKPIRLAGADLVSTRLPDGAAYPLIVEPRVPELRLVEWTREHESFVAELSNRHGALLFRGFHLPDVDAFDAFVRASSDAPLPYRERSSPREIIKGDIYTSTSHPADQEIFLHNEQSYNLTFPGKIYFYCVTPAESRGATPIACTRRILRELPPELVARFEERGYRYVRNFGAGLGLSWQTAFQTTDRAVVERYAEANRMTLQWLGGDRLRTSQARSCVALHPRTGERVWFNHCTFFHLSTLDPSDLEILRRAFADDEMPNHTYYGDGDPIEPETMAALREAYQRAKVAIPWERNDCLLLDNMLMAHGRESFRGPRLVATAMSEPRQWADVVPSKGAGAP